MKRFVQWKCLTLVLSGEISDDIYCSSKEYVKIFFQNGAGSVRVSFSHLQHQNSRFLLNDL